MSMRSDSSMAIAKLKELAPAAVTCCLRAPKPEIVYEPVSWRASRSFEEAVSGIIAAETAVARKAEMMIETFMLMVLRWVLG